VFGKEERTSPVDVQLPGALLSKNKIEDPLEPFPLGGNDRQNCPPAMGKSHGEAG